MTTDPESPKQFDRAFGSKSRLQLLQEYFARAGEITAANAWRHVYRLLLWTDRTTGLVHCYESDKAQPGRPWYARSLAFHDWLSNEFGSGPHEIGGQIDWLFRRGTERLAEVLARRNALRAAKADEQRAPYAGRGFPEPGEDPALEALIREELGQWLAEPSVDALRRLTQRIRTYFGQENKRKNLVGEGLSVSTVFDGAAVTRIDGRTFVTWAEYLPGGACV